MTATLPLPPAGWNYLTVYRHGSVRDAAHTTRTVVADWCADPHLPLVVRKTGSQCWAVWMPSTLRPGPTVAHPFLVGPLAP